jgi:hypothetical protein
VTDPATRAAAEGGTGAAEVIAAPAEPQFAIKSVRVPGATAPAGAVQASTATPSGIAASVPVAQPIVTRPATPEPEPVRTAPTAPVIPPAAPAVSAAAQPAVEPPPLLPQPDAPAQPAGELARESAPAEEAARLDTRAAAEAVAAPIVAAAPHAAASPAPDVAAEQPVFTSRAYLIALTLTGGGVAYLIWRRRQRQLELAATAVSHAPFTTPVAPASGFIFTPEYLAKLTAARFEELVAAYYGKTGVVATRTKAGPHSPVHIKVSWKGEPRPFAYVHCIASPPGLVDAAPVQALFAAMPAENIRRGYVVSTGKFNVAARDFAEERHITLLSGEMFLEKVNALPDVARSDIAAGLGRAVEAPRAQPLLFSDRDVRR